MDGFSVYFGPFLMLGDLEHFNLAQLLVKIFIPLSYPHAGSWCCRGTAPTSSRSSTRPSLPSRREPPVIWVCKCWTASSTSTQGATSTRTSRDPTCCSRAAEASRTSNDSFLWTLGSAPSTCSTAGSSTSPTSRTGGGQLSILFDKRTFQVNHVTCKEELCG